MTTIALNRETNSYWEYIKNASDEVKLALITLLSSSMSNNRQVSVAKPKALKARRLSSMTDEQMEHEMQGVATPIDADSDTPLADIVNGNKGRIVKGLEKWL